ncbi:hypothetical protein SAY87_004819 [Trapa incisa]|nr:hypothetical protein SAY87_004819 [Trapa incisa]
MEMRPSRMRRANRRTRKPMVMQLVEENRVWEYADSVIIAPTDPITRAFAFWFIFLFLVLPKLLSTALERDLSFCPPKSTVRFGAMACGSLLGSRSLISFWDLIKVIGTIHT